MEKTMIPQIISREMITPSSPTPPHLWKFKLSLIDQTAPPTFIPVILFYHSDTKANHSERSSLLKKSLADTLTHFYPLGGRMKEEYSFECNDEGVEYFEAKVPCKLAEVLEHTDMDVMHHFLPYKPHEDAVVVGSEEQVHLAIQYNIFSCGGSALGFRLSHKLADGTSLVSFINAWASVCFNGKEAVISLPLFDGATHFPPLDVPKYMQNIGITREKIVCKRFVFEKSSIDVLREKASSASGAEVKNPTRVEAVSCFLWMRLMAVAHTRAQGSKLYGGLQTVNLRERMESPLPSHSFGNYWQPTAVIPAEPEQEYQALVKKMREAIKEIDSDHVKRIQKEGRRHLEGLQRSVVQIRAEEREVFRFTSWCRFPVYEADFGWGKPTWCCSPVMPFKNLVVMMSNRGGDGIEVWVTLSEEDMAKFERDPELLSYVQPTTNGQKLEAEGL